MMQQPRFPWLPFASGLITVVIFLILLPELSRSQSNLVAIEVFGLVVALLILTVMSARQYLTYERALLDSRNRFQAVLESLTEAVILFSVDGVVRFANPRTRVLLKLPADLIIGRTTKALLDQTNVDFAARLGYDRAAFDHLFSTAQRLTGEVRDSFELYERRLERKVVPVRGIDRRVVGILMVFYDETERFQLQQAREDLSQMVVHDLRSPLTAMNTSMKILGELSNGSSTVDRQIRQTTDVTRRALRKMLNMVNSLLDVSRMESGNLALETEFHQLGPLIEEVTAELAPLAEELDVKFTTALPDSLPALRIDGEKISRVLLNLVDNALKFSPVGGEIVVRARPHDESMVRVDVMDNGPGIPDEQKETVFARFAQGDNVPRGQRRGTGLGLTYCRLAVQAHGCKIWVEDNPSGGSIVSFTLPVAAVAEQE